MKVEAKIFVACGHQIAHCEALLTEDLDRHIRSKQFGGRRILRSEVVLYARARGKSVKPPLCLNGHGASAAVDGPVDTSSWLERIERTNPKVRETTTLAAALAATVRAKARWYRRYPKLPNCNQECENHRNKRDIARHGWRSSIQSNQPPKGKVKSEGMSKNTNTFDESGAMNSESLSKRRVALHLAPGIEL